MPFTTREEAREMSKLANKVRWDRWRKQRDASRNPQPPNGIPSPNPICDAYLATRLAGVREQLRLIDQRIAEEAGRPKADGQRLSWLATASARLAEQERQLAGRPLPGSLKPTQSKRTVAPGAWLVPEVAPSPGPDASGELLNITPLVRDTVPEADPSISPADSIEKPEDSNPSSL